MNTLILSDLHLGSKHCHAALVKRVLEREPFDRLVLNGDTIHNVNMRKWSPAHWGVLDRLRQIGKSRELILLRGNHDHERDVDECAADAGGFGTHSVLPALLEVPMLEETRLDVGGRSYLVLHGDRFDPTLHHPLVTDMAGWCYQVTKKMNKKLAKWLKKKSRKWGGLLEWVRLQSLAYARAQGGDGVVTGHTHYAEDVHDQNVHYLNTGCWTEPPCSYATVAGDRLQLHFLPE